METLTDQQRKDAVTIAQLREMGLWPKEGDPCMDAIMTQLRALRDRTAKPSHWIVENQFALHNYHVDGVRGTGYNDGEFYVKYPGKIQWFVGGHLFVTHYKIEGYYKTDTTVIESRISPSILSDDVGQTTIEKFAAKSGYPAAFLSWLHKELGTFLMECTVYCFKHDRYAADEHWCNHINIRIDAHKERSLLSYIAMPKGLEDHPIITPEFMDSIRQYFEQWVDDKWVRE